MYALDSVIDTNAANHEGDVYQHLGLVISKTKRIRNFPVDWTLEDSIQHIMLWLHATCINQKVEPRKVLSRIGTHLVAEIYRELNKKTINHPITFTDIEQAHNITDFADIFLPPQNMPEDIACGLLEIPRFTHTQTYMFALLPPSVRFLILCEDMDKSAESIATRYGISDGLVSQLFSGLTEQYEKAFHTYDRYARKDIERIKIIEQIKKTSETFKGKFGEALKKTLETKTLSEAIDELPHSNRNTIAPSFFCFLIKKLFDYEEARIPGFLSTMYITYLGNHELIKKPQ
ncbi:hypothetical protein HY486_02045 [Candidatus Woesearchaeota archaeon]|nr:hypothetical protein [Candidatus Woesearchaeota archaeon]